VNTAQSARKENGNVATWALAVAQLVSWGSVYYGFSLFVVPMEQSMGWSRTDTNAALSVGLLVSGLAAYPLGTWIDQWRSSDLPRYSLALFGSRSDATCTRERSASS
jgi:hypothetical protein